MSKRLVPGPRPEAKRRPLAKPGNGTATGLTPVLKLAKGCVRYLRMVFEIFGIGIAVAMVVFWSFPGAWRGLGLSDSVQAVSQTIESTATPPAPPVGAADMMAVLLTVTTIVLAVVAFLISVAAFFGWSSVKDYIAASIENEGSRLKTEMDEDLNINRERIGGVLARVQADFEGFKRGILEERVQGQGLAEGDDADAFARAATGAEASEAP